MSADMWLLLAQAFGDTFYMVLASGIVSFLIGIPLGIMLFVTRQDQIVSSPAINRFFDIVVNIGRSVPFVILMVAVIPFTRWIVGSSIGSTAAIVPLSLAAIPFVGRVTEAALLDLSPGLIEMGLAMGATPFQIIYHLLLPEALPALVQGATLTLVTLVGYSAMAGAVGGGGLGDLSIRYGYQRFNGEMMLLTVVALILMVQVIQYSGDILRKRLFH